jgi:hypothetical protein
MKKWLVFIVGIALLGIFGWWIWSLGELPAEVAPALTVHVDARPVQIRRAGQANWNDANTGDELKVGDAVRTGDQGAATLDVLGQGESRLAPQSQVTIQTAQPSSQSGSTLLVNFSLDAGRLWSRVLRLFDVQSTYEVHTNIVVATVRGTAFDLNKTATGTVLWVSDSAVQVSGSEEGSMAPSPSSQFTVSEGFMASFDPSGTLLNQQAISDAAKQGDWFISNTTRDAAFVEAASKAVQSQFASMHSETPGSVLDDVAQLSEGIHLTFAGDDAPTLYARYAARRLAAIKALMDQGSPGQALQAYSSLEEQITSRTAGTRGAEYRAAIQHELGPVFMLLEDVVPSSPSYRFKQRLEDLNVTLAGTDQLDTAYARLLAVDARLDEAAALINSSSLDDARGLLDTARQGIANVERDIDHVPDDVSPDRLNAVRAKLYALKARETSIRTRLATALQPPTSEFPVSDQGSATSTSSTLETVTTPTSTTETASSSTYVSLSLTVSPATVFVGDTVKLMAVATDANGVKTDVTAKTQFVSASDAVLLNGPLLSARAPGSAAVRASYTDNGKTLTASLTVSVQAKVPVLQSISVVARGSTVLAWNQTVAILVQAQYSDGTQKDVTAATQLTSSNTVLGYFTSNQFHAGTTAAGTDTVIATYHEGSVTKTASLDIQIVSR